MQRPSQAALSAIRARCALPRLQNFAPAFAPRAVPLRSRWLATQPARPRAGSSAQAKRVAAALTELRALRAGLASAGARVASPSPAATSPLSSSVSGETLDAAVEQNVARLRDAVKAVKALEGVALADGGASLVTPHAALRDLRAALIAQQARQTGSSARLKTVLTAALADGTADVVLVDVYLQSLLASGALTVALNAVAADSTIPAHLIPEATALRLALAAAQGKRTRDAAWKLLVRAASGHFAVPPPMNADVQAGHAYAALPVDVYADVFDTMLQPLLTDAALLHPHGAARTLLGSLTAGDVEAAPAGALHTFLIDVVLSAAHRRAFSAPHKKLDAGAPAGHASSGGATNAPSALLSHCSSDLYSLAVALFDQLTSAGCAQAGAPVAAGGRHAYRAAALMAAAQAAAGQRRGAVTAAARVHAPLPAGVTRKPADALYWEQHAWRSLALLACYEQNATAGARLVADMIEWAQRAAAESTLLGAEASAGRDLPAPMTAATILAQPLCVEALCSALRAWGASADETAHMLSTHHASGVFTAAHLTVPEEDVVLLGGVRLLDVRKRDAARAERAAARAASDEAAVQAQLGGGTAAVVELLPGGVPSADADVGAAVLTNTAAPTAPARVTEVPSDATRIRQREIAAVQPMLNAVASLLALPQASPSGLTHVYDTAVAMAIRFGSAIALTTLVRNVAAAGLHVSTNALGDVVSARTRASNMREARARMGTVGGSALNGHPALPEAEVTPLLPSSVPTPAPATATATGAGVSAASAAAPRSSATAPRQAHRVRSASPTVRYLFTTPVTPQRVENEGAAFVSSTASADSRAERSHARASTPVVAAAAAAAAGGSSRSTAPRSRSAPRHLVAHAESSGSEVSALASYHAQVEAHFWKGRAWPGARVSTHALRTPPVLAYTEAQWEALSAGVLRLLANPRARQSVDGVSLRMASAHAEVTAAAAAEAASSRKRPGRVGVVSKHSGDGAARAILAGAFQLPPAHGSTQNTVTLPSVEQLASCTLARALRTVDALEARLAAGAETAAHSVSPLVGAATVAGDAPSAPAAAVTAVAAELARNEAAAVKGVVRAYVEAGIPFASARVQLHAVYVPLAWAHAQQGSLKAAFHAIDSLQASLEALVETYMTAYPADALWRPESDAAAHAASDSGVSTEDMEHAMRDDILRLRARPNSEAFEPLLVGCAQAKQPARANKVLSYILSLGLAPTVPMYENLIRAYAAAGQPQEAWDTLQAAVANNLHVRHFSYLQVMTAYCDERQPAQALYVLRAAQARGFLRLVDCNAHKGVLNVSGLSQAMITTVVYDALRSLRAAVRAGALPPPPTLRVYHSPADRLHIRGVLQSLSPPLECRRWGVGHTYTHLLVESPALVAYFTAPDDDDVAGGEEQPVDRASARSWATAGRTAAARVVQREGEEAASSSWRKASPKLDVRGVNMLYGAGSDSDTRGRAAMLAFSMRGSLTDDAAEAEAGVVDLQTSAGGETMVAGSSPAEREFDEWHTAWSLQRAKQAAKVRAAKRDAEQKRLAAARSAAKAASKAAKAAAEAAREVADAEVYAASGAGSAALQSLASSFELEDTDDDEPVRKPSGRNPAASREMR